MYQLWCIWCICSGMYQWCLYGVYVSVGQREATLKRHAPDWLLAMEEPCTDLAHIKLKHFDSKTRISYL